MSEASEVKAREYLTSGKVKVLEHDAKSCVMVVQGSGKEPYNIIFGNATWHCDCPARKPLCAHVIAAKLISPLRTEVKGLAPLKDPAIDEILGELKSTKAEHADLDFLEGLE